MIVATKHPAKFSPEVLERIEDLLDVHGWPDRILDPFAGVGRVQKIKTSQVVGVEIEPEWAANAAGSSVAASAMALPFPDATFDGLVTSPCYGNRFSDSHRARDASSRRSYTHDLRAALADPERDLHDENIGKVPWGPRYRDMHDRAWAEVLRTLIPSCYAKPRGSLVIVNVSNFFKTIKGELVEQHVAEWHHNWFMDHGCIVVDFDAVSTRRFRHGANRSQRAPQEYIFIMRYVNPIAEEAADDAGQQPVAPHRTGMVDDLDAPDGGRVA